MIYLINRQNQKRRGFDYDHETREASWNENGKCITYNIWVGSKSKSRSTVIKKVIKYFIIAVVFGIVLYAILAVGFLYWIGDGMANLKSP